MIRLLKQKRKDTILPVGFLASGIHCGIKKSKKDLGLILCTAGGCARGFFTVNANPSYSVTFSKRNIKNKIKAVLVNSGNANCFTGIDGLFKTGRLVDSLAKILRISKKSILFSSTGLIGKRLPVEKIKRSFPLLIAKLGKDIKEFSSSILTTDTYKKIVSREFMLNQGKVKIVGVAKGAGMIYPNMATMLGFILTDVNIEKYKHSHFFKEAIERSFNSISVDGCTSTNDTVFILSSNKFALKDSKQRDKFFREFNHICLELAKMIVQDGEGTTKFVKLKIKGAKTHIEARRAGLCIANSLLLKCALYGADPNWGRIIAALGQEGISVKSNIGIKSSSLKRKVIGIEINLKRGNSSWSVYTSDLTPEYVKINSDG
ncbi:MAG: bifunctional glutamate N-acetyltransferase/amino-acid acetyltransferase ArgJ [Candidatus Omnitrophota bacterium]